MGQGIGLPDALRLAWGAELPGAALAGWGSSGRGETSGPSVLIIQF